jgi:hypothetical protein
MVPWSLPRFDNRGSDPAASASVRIDPQWTAVVDEKLSPRARDTLRHLVSQEASTMQTGVQLRYIPRSFNVQPRVRVVVFRDRGSAILDIGYTAITEICKPESEGRENMLAAFRESVPKILGILNDTIAATPAGGVVFITPDMLRVPRQKAAS